MQSKNAEDIDVKAFVKAWADGRHLDITGPKERIAIFKEEFEALTQRTKQDCGGGKMADKIKEKANKMRSMSDKELVDIIRLLENNCKVYLNNLNTYSSIVKELTEVKENLIEFEEE